MHKLSQLTNNQLIQLSLMEVNSILKIEQNGILYTVKAQKFDTCSNCTLEDTECRITHIDDYKFATSMYTCLLNRESVTPNRLEYDVIRNTK